MSEYDYVFVGGGINALVAAAMLGKKGRTTLVLERDSAIGGCLRTEEVTAPGFLHDVMATTLVLFRTAPAYQTLGKDLEARGFAMADTNLPTAVLRPDGSSVILSMDRARNIKTFDALAEGDGRAFKCTMCYDRLKGGLQPACATACPTTSIQFGPLSEMRERARQRVDELHAEGQSDARLYLADPSDGVEGGGSIFLLLDDPHVYGLPDQPEATTHHLGEMWKTAALAAGAIALGVAGAFLGGRRR